MGPLAARALLAAAAVAGVLFHAAARAQMMFEPVVLELSQRQRIAVLKVSLSEGTPAPVRLQAQLLRWTQDATGQAITEPTDALLVTPPIVDMVPGQRQVFRVAVRAPRPSQDEAAYRLILEDISPEPVDASGHRVPGITIRMRYDLPVMVAPSVPVVQSLRFKTCSAKPGVSEACVRIRNAGNKRLRVHTLQLAGEGWQREIAIKEDGLLLTGSEREWRVAVQGADASKLRDVRAIVGRSDNVQVMPEAP